MFRRRCPQFWDFYEKIKTFSYLKNKANISSTSKPEVSPEPIIANEITDQKSLEKFVKENLEKYGDEQMINMNGVKKR